MDLSAYRIVQEALTNIIKHAAGEAARSSSATTTSALELEVTDTSAPPVPGATRNRARADRDARAG